MNVGTLIFGLILIYILITLLLYLTQKHIAGYEVVEGTISGNYRYNAIALKEEEIINSDVSGNVNYYAREGAKANTDMVVCSVGISALSESSNSPVVTQLSEDDLQDAKNEIMTFSVNFSENMFSEVYSFKSDMQGVILQSSVNEEAGEHVSGSYAAPAPGFVVYSIDGMESLTAEDLTMDCFNVGTYQSENLRLKNSVNAGDPLYKLITNDNWNLCFPVNDALKRDLEDVSTIRVRFLKDNVSFSAPIEMVNGKDGVYGKISLKTSLVRYVSDRYLEIELILNRAKGLKIPVSSITEKTFLRSYPALRYRSCSPPHADHSGPANNPHASPSLSRPAQTPVPSPKFPAAWSPWASCRTPYSVSPPETPYGRSRVLFSGPPCRIPTSLQNLWSGSRSHPESRCI